MEIEDTWESGSIIDLQISVTGASFAVGKHLWANRSLSLSLPLSLFQVKAEMEARVCGSSKSRRLTCGPSHFWPIPQQVLPARSATLGAYQMLAQSRPAASLTGPGPRSKFHFDIPNCTFCVSILRQRKRIHSRLPTVSFPHLHDPTISG